MVVDLLMDFYVTNNSLAFAKEWRNELFFSMEFRTVLEAALFDIVILSGTSYHLKTTTSGWLSVGMCTYVSLSCQKR